MEFPVGPAMLNGYLLRIFDLLEQVEEVRLPRIVPRDRQDPFTSLSEDEFIDRYRLTPACTLELLEKVEPLLPIPDDGRGGSIPAHLQLLTAMRYFASGSFQLTMGDCMEMSASSVCKFVRRIAAALTSLSSDYIKFPEPGHTNQLKNDFHDIAGMPGVIGCIDGTFIPIISPGGNTAELYRCRKGYPAINMMGICDDKLRFLNIVSSWPGSVHDNRVFENSRVCHMLEDANYVGYLLGDLAYGCKTYLLTPLSAPETEKEKRYNKAHISTRNVVERTFGVMKQRFAVLRLLRTKLYNAKLIIMATAVLHNIAIDNGMPLQDYIDLPEQQAQGQDGEAVYDVGGIDAATGVALRREIIERWF